MKLIFKLTNEFTGIIGILFRSLEGECLKFFYTIGIVKCRKVGINKDPRREKVIVSLTSYGRRVCKTLPLTITSLLKQTYKPDMIILWLDYSWQIKELPSQIKKLMRYGLTIKYCEDIKSYKKLIPTLLEYPNDIVITTDDDVYYRKNVVERLIKYHNNNPGKIICNDAHLPVLNEKGDLYPYNLWQHDVFGKDNKIVFPVGVGGCLYKKEYLYTDVCDQNLFLKLSPKADDIWFYFMAIMKGTGHVVLPYEGNILIPLDNFYQLLHKESNLSNTNYRESLNDTQISAVVTYYNIKLGE